MKTTTTENHTKRSAPIPSVAMLAMATILLTSLFILGCDKSQAEEPSVQPEVSKAQPSQTVESKNEESASTVKNGFDGKPPVGTKALCPVMKNEFTVNESTQMSEYEGKTYAFCCPGCKPQFDADPKKFL